MTENDGQEQDWLHPNHVEGIAEDDGPFQRESVSYEHLLSFIGRAFRADGSPPDAQELWFALRHYRDVGLTECLEGAIVNVLTDMRHVANSWDLDLAEVLREAEFNALLDWTVPVHQCDHETSDADGGWDPQYIACRRIDLVNLARSLIVLCGKVGFDFDQLTELAHAYSVIESSDNCAGRVLYAVPTPQAVR